VPTLPRTRLYPLEFRREKERFKSGLALVFDDPASSPHELAGEILGKSEAAYFSTLQSAPRQKSYLFGRYAAKLALSDLTSEVDLRALEIVRGVFEQPIVHCRHNPGLSVTISHSASIAIALVYPTGHPCGIDVEVINPTRYQTILSQLSEKEKEWLQASLIPEQETATAIWAAKEALSKVLTTGLMSPMQVYNLAEFKELESRTREGLFENFAQYKVKVWVGTSYAFAVAFPKRSVLDFNADLCAIL
jgi:4'-phosphopantetheinyl transferase